MDSQNSSDTYNRMRDRMQNRIDTVNTVVVWYHNEMFIWTTNTMITLYSLLIATVAIVWGNIWSQTMCLKWVTFIFIVGCMIGVLLEYFFRTYRVLPQHKKLFQKNMWFYSQWFEQFQKCVINPWNYEINPWDQEKYKIPWMCERKILNLTSDRISAEQQKTVPVTAKMKFFRFFLSGYFVVMIVYALFIFYHSIF